jgi:large subunit ribosomal protein L23
MAELHDILLRPVVTERSSGLQASQSTYVFEVGESANKLQIKAAVESVFGVRVTAVRTVRVRGKAKRFGRHIGQRSNWKKAYVRLADGDSLNFYES